MTVLDFKDYSWFLLSKGDRLFLDVHCSHSFVDYSFLLELNEEEVLQYKSEGRDFIIQLANIIQYSAPGVVNSNSEYKKRNLGNIYGDEVIETIRKYRTAK